MLKIGVSLTSDKLMHIICTIGLFRNPGERCVCVFISWFMICACGVDISEEIKPASVAKTNEKLKNECMKLLISFQGILFAFLIRWS